MRPQNFMNDFNFEPIVKVRAALEARNSNERKLTFVPFAASGKEGSKRTCGVAAHQT
jgi:hypothetical protein